jgi:diaminopimelate decarboxylase
MSHTAHDIPETPAHALEQPAPRFDLAKVETPAFVVDLGLLRRNLEKLAMVQRESGAKVLLALKGFSMFSTFPLVRQHLSGCCASGLHEALLAHEEFGKEVHVYAPAFKEDEMRQIIPIADHISFNSLAQWRKHRPAIEAARARGRAPSPGLRVNPEHSEVEVALYDPCSPGCRLGTRADALEGEDLGGLEGLHFHALCEQGSDVLERTLAAVERRFSKFLEQVKWVNMGGGHHITRSDYDVERLIRVVSDFKKRWGKEVYLEPGEAVALNTGYLVASVMDVVGVSPALASGRSGPRIGNHGTTRGAHTFRFRAGPDARSAAASLHQCLQDVARGDDRPDAAQRLHAEAESIRSWAKTHGWLIEGSILGDLSADHAELEGASEHDVILDRPSGRVLKMTKPPNFGARGEASAYLANVLACDRLLGMDWHFEGVAESSQGLHFVSSQTFIEGERASRDEIAGWFAALGFHPAGPDCYKRPDGVMVADARPDNVLKDGEGNLFPIDVHVIGLDLASLPLLSGEGRHGFAPPPPLPTAILDISATCHMPDTLEMPYRPHIVGSGLPGVFAHDYKLGGMSCLAGDVISEYSFPQPPEPGQKLVFTDMAHYTMVKTTTFNGVPHPSIVTFDPETDELAVVRRFGYEDFKRKLS